MELFLKKNWWETAEPGVHRGGTDPLLKYNETTLAIAVRFCTPTQVSKLGTRMQVNILQAFPVITLLKKSMGPKNGLKRRVWQFYIICDKNQLLKVKIEKVTVTLVLRSRDASCRRHRALRNSLHGSMWNFRKPAVTFPPHLTPLSSASTCMFFINTTLTEFSRLTTGRWWEVLQIYCWFGQNGSSSYNFKINRSEPLYGESSGKFPVIWFSS